ncbi:hypothetical protein [Streptomyces sp. NPDC095817]|uniref:hypothetical protein n=1 Tax=Streptomyces sp. NPDC095817 TaxID=3155082 RepID=UPI00331C08EE
MLDLSVTFRLGLPVPDVLEELRAALKRRGIALHLDRLRASAGSAFDAHPLAGRLGPSAVHADVQDAVTALGLS